MMNKFNSKFGGIYLATAFLALLAGCSSTDTDMVQTLAADTSTPVTPVNPGPSQAELDEQLKREQMLAVTLFYFDFDKSELKPQSLEALRYHAQRLKDNPSMQVRLEGHADERGTPEYNLALGERRGIAVQRYLQVQGVNARQLEVISYGEERPVALGSGEQNWSQNRRVELKF